MTLPVQVRQQVENAQKLQEQLSGGQKAAPAESAKPEGSEVAVEAKAENETAAPAAESTEQVRTPEKTATPAGDENSPTDAQRWRSLQGINNSLMQRIRGLEEIIASMQREPAQPEVRAPEVAKHVTSKDEEEYGADMVDFARRAAREELNTVMQTLAQMQRQMQHLSTLAPAVQQVAVKQQATAEERFFEQLGRSVPNWAVINDNPKFHAWLLTPDEMTGITRQTYLADAQNSFDLHRVVSIFRAWERESGVAPAAAQESAQRTTQSQLEKQVAPGRASAATAAPQAKQGKQWTREGIQQFFQDKIRGKYKGREADAAAMERDIFLAQREGRVSA